MNWTDVIAVLSAIGSSGVSVIAWNFWNSHKIQKSAQKAEERNEKREPYIETSIQLGSAAKAMDILRKGMDELEDSKRRLREEFKEKQDCLEDKLESLTNENERLRDEFFEQQAKIRSLNQELNKLRGTDECSGTTD